MSEPRRPLAEFADSNNPYQAPQTALQPGVIVANWQREPVLGVQWIGDELRAPALVQLPGYCVRCNQPVDMATYKKRAVYYQSPWLLLLILVNLLVFAIVTLIVRKRCDVTYGYCEYHRIRRRNLLLAGLAGMVLGVVLAIASGSQRQPNGLLVGVGVSLVVISIISLLFLHKLSAKNYDNGWFSLRGFSREFIEGNPTEAQIPSLPPPWPS